MGSNEPGDDFAGALRRVRRQLDDHRLRLPAVTSAPPAMVRAPGIVAGLILAVWAMPLWAETSATAEMQIRDRLNRWVEQTNQGRFEAANTIWDKGVIGWYPGQPDFTDEAVAKSIARGDSRQAPNRRYVLKVDEVIVEGSLAVVRDRWWRFRRTDAQAAWAVDSYLRSFEVWRRTPRGWKIMRWISAPEPAPNVPPDP